MSLCSRLLLSSIELRGTIQPYYLKYDYTHAASSLLQAEQDLLALVRTPAERKANDIIWLRTCYFDKDGNTTDEAHENLFKQSDFFYHPEFFEGSNVLFDDVTRYNYGPEWQKIFTRVPELVETDRPPEELEREKAEAIEEAHYAEDHPSENMYSESDESDWELHWSGFHRSCVVGVMFVADKKAIKTGEVLLAWYDDCGRIVRSGRVKDTSDVLYLLMLDKIVSGPWECSEIGEDYDLGGAFGPQSRESGSDSNVG